MTVVVAVVVVVVVAVVLLEQQWYGLPGVTWGWSQHVVAAVVIAVVAVSLVLVVMWRSCYVKELQSHQEGQHARVAVAVDVVVVYVAVVVVGSGKQQDWSEKEVLVEVGLWQAVNQEHPTVYFDNHCIIIIIITIITITITIIKVFGEINSCAVIFVNCTVIYALVC